MVKRACPWAPEVRPWAVWISFQAALSCRAWVERRVADSRACRSAACSRPVISASSRSYAAWSCFFFPARFWS